MTSEATMVCSCLSNSTFLIAASKVIVVALNLRPGSKSNVQVCDTPCPLWITLCQLSFSGGVGTTERKSEELYFRHGMTLRYAHLAPEHQLGAVQKLCLGGQRQTVATDTKIDTTPETAPPLPLRRDCNNFRLCYVLSLP